MEKTLTKVLLLFFTVSSGVWLFNSTMRNIEAASLLKVGTIEYKEHLDPSLEAEIYRSTADRSVIGFISYSFALLTGFGYVMTTHRSMKEDGRLLISAILIVIFIPAEIYCFWIDWKIVGMTYWGHWSLDELRTVVLRRISALAGLHLIALLCYFTIPIFIIFKPLKKTIE